MDIYKALETAHMLKRSYGESGHCRSSLCPSCAAIFLADAYVRLDAEKREAERREREAHSRLVARRQPCKCCGQPTVDGMCSTCDC